MEAYMVEVIAEYHCQSTNSFFVGFQHVCCYGKARRSGTAGTFRHAPRIEYGQNGQRHVFTHHHGGIVFSDEETSRQGPRSEEAGCWVCAASNGEGCHRNTPAMLGWNQTDRCLPGQNGTTQNPETRWRLEQTGASPRDRRWQPTPEPTPPLPGMPLLPRTPPAPPSNNATVQHS